MANGLIPQELDDIIQQYLTDGTLTEKQRAEILQKATSLGLDCNEVNLYLDAEVEKFEELEEELEEISDNFDEYLSNLSFWSGYSLFRSSKSQLQQYAREVRRKYGSNSKLQKLLEHVQTVHKRLKKKHIINFALVWYLTNNLFWAGILAVIATAFWGTYSLPVLAVAVIICLYPTLYPIIKNALSKMAVIEIVRLISLLTDDLFDDLKKSLKKFTPNTTDTSSKLYAFIKQYVTDHVLTKKKRGQILRKAERLGCNRDKVNRDIEEVILREAGRIINEINGGRPVKPYNLRTKVEHTNDLEVISDYIDEHLRKLSFEIGDSSFNDLKDDLQKCSHDIEMEYGSNPKAQKILENVQADLKRLKKKHITGLMINALVWCLTNNFFWAGILAVIAVWGIYSDWESGAYLPLLTGAFFSGILPFIVKSIVKSMIEDERRKRQQ